MLSKDLLDCVSYFKDNQGFNRVFEGMRSKFLSLGSISGTVKLYNLKEIEKSALTGFLCKDYLIKSSAVIKLSDFQKALDSTKFKGLSMLDILKEYFKEDLVPNTQAKLTYEQKRASFFEDLIKQFAETPAKEWLSAAITQKNNSYKSLVQKYDADKEMLLKDVSNVCKAINELPYMKNERTPFPVFASSIVLDPHALDVDTFCGQLFIQALTYHFGCLKPKNAYERAELLYKSGILINEMSSWVMCYGLNAFDAHENIHVGWKGFADLNEPLQATLLNLSNLSRVAASENCVFVVENPAVFSSILIEARKLKKNNFSLVCTYGQISIAGLALLDLLAASNSKIYYSGDFDPEGINIADKLKSRYGDNLKLWRFTTEDYQASLSSNRLNKTRLKQLDNIRSFELLPLAEEMKTTSLCGYQEMILNALIDDVLKH